MIVNKRRPRQIIRMEFQAGGCRANCDGVRIMGDKSPKATNKQAAQKQAKANTNTQQKNNAAAAKQVVKTKK